MGVTNGADRWWELVASIIGYSRRLTHLITAIREKIEPLSCRKPRTSGMIALAPQSVSLVPARLECAWLPTY